MSKKDDFGHKQSPQNGNNEGLEDSWQVLPQAHSDAGSPQKSETNVGKLNPAKKLNRILHSRLSSKHYNDLKKSGLSDQAIHKGGFYTELDPETVWKHLNWSFTDTRKTMGPFLAIPYHGLDGKPNGYTRFKPDYPRFRTDDETDKQKTVKYEAPMGKPTQPYFPPMAIPVIRDPSKLLIITEGEKKALKATQEGFPAIGLPGVSNWSTPRKGKSGVRKERELHEVLTQIPWDERPVTVIFDRDTERNPNVCREAAELARVLEKHGAVVTIVSLPLLRNRKKKCFEKQGLDDYLIRKSPEDLDRLIRNAARTKKTVPLDEYRSRMSESHEQMEPNGQYHVNTAPPGLGKSHLDVCRSRREKKSLFLVPTHTQIIDIVDMGIQQGLHIATFPIRSEENCIHIDKVTEIQEQGFNPSEIVCPACIKKRRANAREKNRPFMHCLYKQEFKETNKSDRIAATHQRYRFIGSVLCKDKNFISVQEDAVNILAPLDKVSIDFREVMDFLDWMHRIYPPSSLSSEFLPQMRICINRLVDACKKQDKAGINKISVSCVRFFQFASGMLYNLIMCYYIASEWEKHLKQKKKRLEQKKKRLEEREQAKSDNAQNKEGEDDDGPEDTELDDLDPIPHPWQNYTEPGYDVSQGPPESLLHRFTPDVVTFLLYLMSGRMRRVDPGWTSPPRVQ